MSKNNYQKIAVAPEIDNITVISYQQSNGSEIKKSRSLSVDQNSPVRSRGVSRSDSFFVPTVDSPLLPSKSRLFIWCVIWIVLSLISTYLDYTGSFGTKLFFLLSFKVLILNISRRIFLRISTHSCSSGWGEK